MRTTTTYSIDGNLDDKGWVEYGKLGSISEEDAVMVFESWRESRDREGFGVRYRLVRRVTQEEIVRREGAA